MITAAGTTITAAWVAILAAPVFPLVNRPSGLRVPSGNMPTAWPSLIKAPRPGLRPIAAPPLHGKGADPPEKFGQPAVDLEKFGFGHIIDSGGAA
ncbi:MAG: hypothetical protein R2932_56520 [Caldilineaceae bacterium]